MNLKVEARKIRAVTISVVVISVVCFTYFAFRGGPVKKNEIAETGFNFHPDMVKELKWVVFSEPKLEQAISRKSRREEWAPAVPTDQVQSKLNLLSTLKYQKMKPPRRPVTSVTVSFGPGNEWRGDYDGDRFVWIEGLIKGTGVRFDQESKRIFEQGRYAFDNLSYDWCSARPEKIEIKSKSKALVITQSAEGWFLEKGKTRSRLNPTRMEKWLGAHCSVQVRSFRDLGLFPLSLGLADGYFLIHFPGHKKLEISIRDNYYILSKDQAMLSDDLSHSLDELSAPDLVVGSPTTLAK